MPFGILCRASRSPTRVPKVELDSVVNRVHNAKWGPAALDPDASPEGNVLLAAFQIVVPPTLSGGYRSGTRGWDTGCSGFSNDGEESTDS